MLKAAAPKPNHQMRTAGVKRVLARGLALGAVGICLAFSALAAQTPAGGPDLTPGEAEAHEMGLTLSSFCNPARHRRMGASEAVVRRGTEELAGTASYLRSAEGTFLVLEQYDQAMAGHCLVLGWFGGDLEPGRYAIRQLAMTSLEAEVGGTERAFYAMAAVRAPDESSVLVTESGALEITDVERDGLTGTFEISGFVMEGETRTNGVAWEGSFHALEEG